MRVINLILSLALAVSTYQVTDLECLNDDVANDATNTMSMTVEEGSNVTIYCSVPIIRNSRDTPELDGNSNLLWKWKAAWVSTEVPRIEKKIKNVVGLILTITYSMVSSI